MQDLRSGTFADTEGIARTFKLNDAHVRRILRFAYLAPDIGEAIAAPATYLDSQAPAERYSQRGRTKGAIRITK